MSKVSIFLPILGAVALVVSVLVILLLTSVSRYAKYWQRETARADQNNPLIYASLGDSTAQGIGASSPARGYVGLLAAKLTAEKGRPVHIINLSKSGAKIGDVLETQIPLLVSLKPDIITIEIGANDMKSFSAITFERQARALVEQLPPGTHLSDIPFFGGRSRFLEPALEQNVEAANQILHRLASEHKIRLVELHAATKQHNLYPWDYAIDYFHPSNLGYKAWFEAFWENIK